MDPRWRNKRTWNLAGLVLTAAWFTVLAMASGGDTAHPLFNFVFLVPLAIWLIIIIATKLLGIREPDEGGKP